MTSPIDSTDAKAAQSLLTRSQRLRYSLLPKKLYGYLRGRRMLRRGEVELRMLPFLLEHNRNSVDVGANKGTYTYFLAKLSKHVFAYEPNPAMRGFLKTIVPENVTISDRAVSDHPGEAILGVPNSPRGYSNNVGTLKIDRLDDFQQIVVQQVRLDDEHLEDIGFIKIDVEGLEQEVLRGAEQTILRERPVLLVEIIQEHTGRPIEDTVQYVESLGYRTMAAWDDRLVDFQWFHNECERARQQGGDVPRVRNFIFFPLQVAERAAA